MKKSILFALFSVLLLFINQVQAQQQSVENPVKWNYSVVVINDSVAELRFTATIEKNWHLYAQCHRGMEMPLVFEFKSSDNYKCVGKVVEPKPHVSYEPSIDNPSKQDTLKYFAKQATFKQRILVKTGLPFAVKGNLSGQACINGRCVSIDTKFSFDIKGFEKLGVLPEKTESDSANLVDAKTELNAASESASTADTPQDEKKESLLRFFITAFWGGLIGLLMPCVFPMIPMTVSYFIKMKEKAKLYALVFGTSIVLIFIVLGVGLSLIFGADIGNKISTHWLPNILFAVIFVIFAISLFGYFEITLPSRWVNGSAKMENKGGLIGVFFMALTLVLVSFSCTLPIAGTVALSSAGGSFLKPIIGMLGFSLGIAVPFTLFAFFPGMLKNLPKSGGWMNTMKVTLAFVELAFALKFLNVPDQTYHWGILDREVYLAIWIVIFSMLGFYLLGRIRFPHDDEMPVQKSWVRYILAIAVFSFVVYLIPGMVGAPLKAISGWLPPMTTQDFDVNAIVRQEVASLQNGFTNNSDSQSDIQGWETPKYADKMEMPFGIKGYFDYHQALKVAKKMNRPLFIDFTGHGCTNCRNVENAVWIDAKVRNKFANEFVVAALYVDDKTVVLDPEDQIKDADNELITKLGRKNLFISNTIYKQNSQPCYFIVDYDGTVLAGPTFYELNVENYLNFMNAGIEAFNEKHGK